MVTISNQATVAVAGADQNICGATVATLNATNVTTGTGEWTQVGGAGGAVITSPSTRNTTVTNLASGTYIFRWTVTNGACPGSFDEVQINVATDGVVSASAGPDQSICGVSTATMAANSVSPGNGFWSIVSGPNVPNITDASSPTTTVTNLEAGTYTFKWTSVGASFCPSSSDLVDITITPAANAGADQTLCLASSINLT